MTDLQISSTNDVRERVLAAARVEVMARGILGLRVINVAAAANCSVTSMYRYFGSREGMLAEVLVALYEESFAAQYAVMRERVGGTGPLTVEDVIAAVPLPFGVTSQQDHALRSQVLAVAGTNSILRGKLAESLRARRKMLMTGLDNIEQRLPPGTLLDRELLATLVFNVHWQYNDLMGDAAVSNEQFVALLRRLIVKK
jgi:AcrR family transcriptional regulator